MKQKARRWYVIIGAVLIMGLLIAGFRLFKKPEDVVLKIDKYAVTQDHLALYEDQFRAEVTSYFYREYQLNPNREDFWTTQVGGETPAAVLTQQAMDSLVYDTVERIEAAKYGILADITLAEMMNSQDQENANRRSSDSLSYGPDQYGLMEYISRTQMEVRDGLKEKLLEKELKPTEEQLKAVYNSADPVLFDKGCKARVGIYMFYGMKVGEYPEELKPVWDAVEKGLAQGKLPADIVAEANALSEVKIEYEVVEYDTADMPRDNQEMAWLAEQTRDLEPGGSSGVLDYGASQGILTVLDKTDYGRVGYEESETLLRNLWLEQAYPEYITQCMANYGYNVKN